MFGKEGYLFTLFFFKYVSNWFIKVTQVRLHPVKPPDSLPTKHQNSNWFHHSSQRLGCTITKFWNFNQWNFGIYLPYLVQGRKGKIDEVEKMSFPYGPQSCVHQNWVEKRKGEIQECWFGMKLVKFQYVICLTFSFLFLLHFFFFFKCSNT